MSRKITQEVFLERFTKRFPDAKVEILQYESLKKPCSLKCLSCGKEYNRARAESFLAGWNCCGGHGESGRERIRRLCEENGHYKLVKVIDGGVRVIIKHLDCGMEMTRFATSAVLEPCACRNCYPQGIRGRIDISEAQRQLDEAFEGTIEVLFFDGADSKKSQFRCKKCGLIFNKDHYNLVTKCRGCPKCDARRSKGEIAMRKYLDERGFVYNEQVMVPELGRLKFDFGILDKSNNYVAFIEVQGEQHFREVFHYSSRPNNFENQQKHDEEKRQWCKKNEIPLYEVINESGKLKNLDILENLSSTTISAKESTP